MSTKFVRCVAVLAVIASIVGNSGVVRADRSAPPSVSAQNLQPPRAPETQPLDLPALTLPPASSLGVQFVHVATAANSAVDWTTIDHPLTNGKPDAKVFVTPNYNPGGVGGTTNPHPINVWYDGSKWAISNQDGVTPMPVNAAFNVFVPTTDVFTHTATVANILAASTMIDNPLTNGHPDAIIFVTPNFNPGGGAGTTDPHPIGVTYFAGNWWIFNEDDVAMPDGAAFNVFVPTAGAGVFVHTATAENGAGTTDWTTIDNPLTNGNPNAIVFVTQNDNPGGGASGPSNPYPINVWYTGSKWAISNQTGGTTMPVGAAFNVLVLVPVSDIFVHTATAGNSGGDWTKIDNALTNGHANAITFVTPNFNPGGVGGTTDPHPLGVYYNNIASQWAIFNQDIITIPVHAAFNVLVPNPDTSVFVHKAAAANTPGGDYTIIDYPLTNGKPDAIIFVTPNYNPGGVGGKYDNHPIGVGYVSGKWLIINEDLADMPLGAAFNVFVPTAGPNVFVHTATAGNIYSDYTIIDKPLTNGNPNAIVFVTQDAGGASNPYPLNVYYTGSKWAISNQTGGDTMPAGASFNVYVFGNKIYLPLVLKNF